MASSDATASAATMSRRSAAQPHSAVERAFYAVASWVPSPKGDDATPESPSPAAPSANGNGKRILGMPRIIATVVGVMLFDLGLSIGLYKLFEPARCGALATVLQENYGNGTLTSTTTAYVSGLQSCTDDLATDSIIRCLALVVVLAGAWLFARHPQFEQFLPADVDLEAAESATNKKTGQVPTGRAARERFLLQDNEDKERMLEEEEREVDPCTRAERLRRSAVVAADRRKRYALGFAFVTCTVFEVYVGIKAVVFDFTSEKLQAVQFCLTVLLINLELFFVFSAVGYLTKDKGHLFPQVHHHPLFYDYSVAGHRCDFCGGRIRESYRCNPCDYDLCMFCFRKKDKRKGENQLRSDSGVKETERPSNYQYLTRTLSFASSSTTLIMGAFAFLLISSLCRLLTPNYQGHIIDNVVKTDFEAFKYCILMYIIVEVIAAVFGSLRGICFNIVASKIENGIRNHMFSSVLIQDIAFFDGTTSGEVTSRLYGDTLAMVGPAQGILSELLTNVITLVGGLIMCLVTSWKLSLLAFTTIGPILLITKFYAKWSRHVTKEIWAALGDANAVAVQAISNIRTVRAFSMEKREIKAYGMATSEALSQRVKEAIFGAGAFAITNSVDLAVGILLLCYGGIVAMNDPSKLSVGNLITFQLYWNMLNNSYSSIAGQISAMVRAGGAAQRVMGLLENLPDIDPDSGIKAINLEGSIEFRNVQFFYQMRPENIVLKDVSLKIERGQTCAIVGRSGSGKTTLINLLMRYYDTRGGTILIDGVSLNEWNLRSVHAHMGLVSQDTQLFSGTVEENIAYGVEKYTAEEMIEAAKLASAHDFICEFEDGYQTRIGERGARISGGQKQRIAIARMLLRKPRILLLDEATSSLDTESEAQVQAAIDNLIKVRYCTVILVAHRISTVVNADIIAVMDSGRIVEQGNHESLLAQGGVYSLLVRRQLVRMSNTMPESKGEADIIDNLLAATKDEH
ncbi:ATP-binding cassette transporter, subfamily B, member 4, group TAP protein PpABCB4 MET type [Pelomyxa schiedti]|nr:ATP-binding cassette transporter, subfamily B, member 4, group TAP protein PpABCB4 MET type [Pelomyxa schiedti]